LTAGLRLDQRALKADGVQAPDQFQGGGRPVKALGERGRTGVSQAQPGPLQRSGRAGVVPSGLEPLGFPQFYLGIECGGPLGGNALPVPPRADPREGDCKQHA
jgi:hypothetical protein